MAGTGVKGLRIYQIGKETVHGTAVATTTRIVGEFEVTPHAEVKSPTPQNGILMSPNSSDAILSAYSDISWKGELTVEQILHLLEMSIQGGVTPTGTTPKVWDYSPTLTADPALSTFSLQRRLTDGTTNWDEGIAYVFCDSFDISGDQGDYVKFDAKLKGRPVDTAVTLTPAIAVPAVNYLSTADATLYIDDTFAALGTTAVTGALVSWKHHVQGMYQQKFYQDGRSDRSFSSHSLREFMHDLTISAEWLAAISSERAKAASRATRFIRLKIGTGNAIVQIDGAYRYKEGQFDQKGDRQGNDLAPLELEGIYDSTDTFTLKYEVSNSLTTLP